MEKLSRSIDIMIWISLVMFLSLICLEENHAQGGDLPGDGDIAGYNAVIGTSGEGASAHSASYYAIIAGIADYPGSLNDLEYTDDDALDMRDALLQYPNWNPSHIQLLLDGSASVQGIYDAIQNVAEIMTRNDILLFYFSGHGTNKTDKAPLDEVDGKDEYLCAYDDGISDDQLSAWLGTLDTSHVVVMLDTCFSGGQIEDDGGARSRTFPGTLETILRGDGFAADFQVPRQGAKDFEEDDGYIVLTACDDNQLSMELSSLGNGLFTYLTLMVFDKNCGSGLDQSLSAEDIGKRTLWAFWAMYAANPSLYSYLGQMPQFLDGYPVGSPTSAELPLCY